MQVDQHLRNLRALRVKVGKARTPKDHEAVGKEITDAIKKIGCNPDKIFYTVNSNKIPNFSVKRAIRTKVGTKKIGAGEYGTIFLGCVDRECKKSVAIKIQTDSLQREYKIGKMMSTLGGVKVYAYENCGDKHIMYSEYANNGSLEDFIKKKRNTLRPIHYRSIITQVLYNLYRISKKYPSFRHSDLHAKNVLINMDTPTLEPTKYQIGKITLNVEDVGVSALLSDYGLSMTNSIKNPLTKGLDKNWGISLNSHPMYDAHLFLSAMYQVCAGLGVSETMETVRFIQRILPMSYIGFRSPKIENFRLRINADHSGLPSFEKIFSDPYFLPYRSTVKLKNNPLNFIPKAKPIVYRPKPKPKTTTRTSESAIQRAKSILQKEAKRKAAPIKRRVARTSPLNKISIAPKGYVRVNGKKCTTYKKKDIVEIAKKMGVDVQGKTIEKICESLKIKYVK